MIRVLEVLATLKRAGAETMAVSLACGLDRSRFEPAVVSLYDAFEGGFEPVLAGCGVGVRHLGKRRGFDPRMFPRLRDAIREFRPDVVHSHSYVMRYVLPVANCAMVHTVHNMPMQEVDRIGRVIHRIGFRRGVAPVAVASRVARSFEDVYGFPPLATIPNGIDLSRFRQRKSREPGEVTIISVARLDPQKNPRLLVEAFRRLPSNCRLLLVGAGALRAELEGIDRVKLLGARSDIPELLSGADLFALASDWEGHPIAVMEAIAAGLPVVATAVGGVPEIVGDAGVLVPPRDVEALARALTALAEDPVRRQQLSCMALNRAGAFDVRRMVEAYEAVFEQVVRR
jgi:glycosyltransferase involved in cell wall biosynthesis